MDLLGSRYFLRSQKKVKKSNGQMLAINEVWIAFRCSVLLICLKMDSFIWVFCSTSYRFLRRTPRKSRITVSGCVIRAELGTTTCTRSTVTPHSMVQWSRCTLRWLLAIEWGSLAFKSLRLQQSLQSCARERALSSSITRRSSSLLFSERSGHQAGSSRLPIRHQSLTFSCKTNLTWFFSFQPSD